MTVKVCSVSELSKYCILCRLTAWGSAARAPHVRRSRGSGGWRQPSGGSIGTILGPCIEGYRRAWGSLMNGVDDSFEQGKAPVRQADASSDYDAIVVRRD